jgi:hypothetical protein
MQQRLTLTPAASEIAMFAVLLQLRDVTSSGAPTSDLTQIIFMPAPTVIPAIPLEPAARIIRMDPTLAPPLRERLRRDHAKKIQRSTRPIRRKLGPSEPARRKFLATIGHVLPAKHAKLEHLFRRQLGSESGAECAPRWFRAEINVTLLHFVVHFHADRLHFDLLTSPYHFPRRNRTDTNQLNRRRHGEHAQPVETLAAANA